MFFVDIGPRSASPILLLHGFPLNHTMWQAQLNALSAKYRCIAPDLRGFGQSFNAADENAIDLMADDVFALMNYIGLDTATICGFSIGGYVSFAMWRKQPQRFKRWMLLDTKASRDSAQILAGRYKLIESVSRNGARAATTALLPRLLHLSTAHPELVQKVRRMVMSTAPASITQGTRAMIVRMDAAAILPSISVPTCIVAGEHDTLAPVSEAMLMQERIPNASLEVIRGVGHLTPMEAPVAVTQIMREFMGA
ncbi:MAG: alpha/beta hydrolase [Anaerolineae bacterium]|nr:alpha/beta hydrolase [Anaerolineae bacterium]